MICILALLNLNGTLLEQEVSVKQIVSQNEFNYKIKYDVPKNSMLHYFNRGIMIVDKSKCKKGDLNGFR
jgi:hypothetical protein